MPINSFTWRQTNMLGVYFSLYIVINLGFVCRLFQVPEPNASLWTQTRGSCAHRHLSATQSGRSTYWPWQPLTEGCLLAAPPAPSQFRSDVRWSPASTNTLSAHLFNIKEGTGRWEDSCLWAPQSSCRHISLTSDKPSLPSPPFFFLPLWLFQKGNFYLKWKSGIESNTPSWLVMRASCRPLWSRSYAMTLTLFF